MAQDNARDNIADGLVASASFTAPSLSPKKAAPKKKRAKSIGPGGLEKGEEAPLKASSGNRRKSAFVPAVKSILSSNAEDEKKRKEARRKSLAKRRVSFAPEATLHTWDVVEYMRDATSSSAASDATRRASLASQAQPESDPAEPPSTPPEQLAEAAPDADSSPANQRESHQKKNRRSSGIPPMNFNNPDDVYSSSPLSADNAAESESEDDDATTDLRPMPDIEDSSQSSARLDAALRQAFEQAGTQKLDLDEYGEMTMEMADDEITASFKPWARKAAEAQDSSSPAPSDADDDMSMDVTRAIGRIVNQPDASSDMEDDTGMSMELTMPLGSIQAMAKGPANRRKSLKRSVSAVEPSQGSPAKKPASRRTSLRNRRKSEEPADDATMDLTMAIGGIKKNTPVQDDDDRRSSMGSVAMDETMDLTMAVGSIKTAPAAEDESDGDDGFTMEFTKVVGPGIKRVEKPTEAPATVDYPVLPELAKSPTPEVAPPVVKAQTPQKSPKESRSVAETAPETQLDPLPVPVERTPTKAKLNLDPGTPEFVRQLPAGDVEPSPFVRRTPLSSLMKEVITTPVSSAKAITTPSSAKAAITTPASHRKRESFIIPADPVDAPILNRRRSSLSGVQFSPISAPRDEPTLRSTALLSNSIKLLSTPRKASLASPAKRSMTPKKSQTPQKQATPKQKTPTPKKTPRRSLSPKKRVVFGAEPEEEAEDIDEASDVERISLSEFLSLTKITFMDVSASKRRATVAPAAFLDMDVDETPETLDRYVVAGACTVPQYELYSHACHEMKRYISSGREAVRQIEADVGEDNPLLFSEYLTAPPDQRVVMDTQFKNMKVGARLEARGEWYSWRSTLLGTLKAGLLSTVEAFKHDETSLSNQERLLDVVLPPLVERQQQLAQQQKQLQQRHDELNSCDREELEQARENLIAADADLQAKRELLVQLQQEYAEKEASIEAVKERKVECLAEIKAAERVREECRGWSTTEVRDLKAKVSALELAHGWSITSASATTITMTLLSDLELYFHPHCFATTSPTPTPNGPISLAYIGDTARPHPRPLTTSKRFFLQLLRAHLHALPQATTPVAALLALVRATWDAALSVAAGVAALESSFVTEECILGDERMGVRAALLLPQLQTKVRVDFGVAVVLGSEVETQVGVRAEVVYGEKYGEEKMGAFLREFVGPVVREGGMGVWAEGVRDLGERLRRTGRKGERK
ncbi:Spc7 kinetochore protein-domain-containing protein [Boeremia exigua]|uniref:Spc7 kinetochore protein-domain-containing protein n=1 Tax=Boeremia exigua TaxID=749465 RepID=UPI001E8D5F9E|nr:Spc7 kinetochore protein-domain-containing protein [Boeremia exigua]KAH6620278.1 Spc7 kinetochore protein-domain-containing protein [Boeremia exigua]